MIVNSKAFEIIICKLATKNLFLVKYTKFKIKIVSASFPFMCAQAELIPFE